MSWDNRARFEISGSAWNDPLPTWLDITPYVSGWRVTDGAADSTDAAQFARLTVSLLNADDRFTAGNTSSPYYPWWGVGARIRCYETIGPRRLDHFTGFVEVPAMTVVLPGVDQTVTVAGVDLLGWLQSRPAFTSTIGALLESEDDTLVGWYPLSDTMWPFESRRDGDPIKPTMVSISGTADLGASLLPANTAGPTGEDISFLRIQPVLTGLGAVAYPDLRGRLSVTCGSGQSLALSCWVYIDPQGATDPGTTLLNLHNELGAISEFLEIANSTTSNYCRGQAFYDFPTGSNNTAQTGALPWYMWHFVTVRLSLPSGLIELWIDNGIEKTATMSGSPPSSMDFDTIVIANSLVGSVGHVQVRLGADVFPRTSHQAHYQHGINGLAQQLTGERVRTITGYAGVPAGLVDADDGVAVMSVARLAGKNPLTALQEPRTTEQGRLHTVGEKLTFRDRHSRYDL